MIIIIIIIMEWKCRCQAASILYEVKRTDRQQNAALNIYSLG